MTCRSPSHVKHVLAYIEVTWWFLQADAQTCNTLHLAGNLNGDSIFWSGFLGPASQWCSAIMPSCVVEPFTQVWAAPGALSHFELDSELAFSRAPVSSCTCPSRILGCEEEQLHLAQCTNDLMQTRGGVELWMAQLEASIAYTLKKAAKACFQAYPTAVSKPLPLAPSNTGPCHYLSPYAASFHEHNRVASIKYVAWIWHARNTLSEQRAVILAAVVDQQCTRVSYEDGGCLVLWLLWATISNVIHGQ